MNKERVTNEQAQADKDCKEYKECEQCPHWENGCQCGERSIEEYAAELLDARKERDEAIAMNGRRLLMFG